MDVKEDQFKGDKFHDMDESELYQMEDDNTHRMAKLEDTGTVKNHWSIH